MFMALLLRLSHIHILFPLFIFFFMHSLPILEAQEPSQKVALLFLTVADLNFPELWMNEIQASRGQYNVYVHSKTPMQHPFFKKHRIKNIVKTTWSQHVKAWQALIKEALKNPENTKFVLLSESCVPLYPLSTIYHVLTKDTFSYVDYKRPWWPRKDAREIIEIPLKHRYGSSEFMVLSREHAQHVAQDKTVIEIISRHPIDNEAYFPTLFSIKNCLGSCKNHSYTYVNWEHRGKNPSHPYSFERHDTLSKTLIKQAYAQGKLFMRKVAKTFPEGALLSYMKAFDQERHYLPKGL